MHVFLWNSFIAKATTILPIIPKMPQTEEDQFSCTYDPPKFIDAVKQPSGDIYSPGYLANQNYSDDQYCLYEIIAAPGQKIKVTFVDLNIQVFDSCGKDVLCLFESPDEYSPIIGCFCGSEIPKPLISPGNEIHMLFSTDFMGGGRGFHLRYEASVNPKLCPETQAVCRNRNCYDPVDICNGQDDCGDGTDEQNCGRPIPDVKCGNPPIAPMLSVFGRDRIVGGTAARQGSWPWQVDIQNALYYPNGQHCGGTLISPQWVVTAFHCFQEGDLIHSMRVHLGKHHKFKTDQQEQIRYIERIVVYPGDTGDEVINIPVDMVHDIALLKLNAPVKMTDYVQPACLPLQGQKVDVGTRCYSTGWGTTRGTGYNDILKQVGLNILEDRVCLDDFTSETMICAGNEKDYSDSCHGDSGGPFVCKINNLWNLIGIVSFGTTGNFLTGNCAIPGHGAVYNKVSSKTDWIYEMIELYG